jgi:glycosyltransferase involved in cell wall biosynthesis
MNSDVTICIPTIPPRADFLHRAVTSVRNQTIPVGWVVATDVDHEGAWATRNKAARMATTEWIGFLDDDDVLMAHHVEHLLEHAFAHDAAMAWGWFHVIGGTDPFPHYRGRQYDPAHPHIVPITYLVQRELFLRTSGFQSDVGVGAWDTQDQPVIDEIYSLSDGAIVASPRKTWWWHHHGANTSGMPTRW